MRAADEAVWRRSQRRRRRRDRGPRLTLRGRITLAALLLGLAGGAAWIAEPWQAPDGPSLAEALPEPPPVEAPPPPPPDDTVPPEVLERLPVTHAALELPSTDQLTPDPDDDGYVPGLLYESYESYGTGHADPLRVEYTLDAELTRRVFRTLRRGRVRLGHVILLDPANGRVLAYASTDVASFPPTRAYPAASLVKVITAAAALDRDPETAQLPCRFRGSPYRLTEARIDPPPARDGRTVSLRRALATSNNQCFAQLAVHAVGEQEMLSALSRFGWLRPPARAHPAGSVDRGEGRYGLGQLGCGLAGARITPLHAAQLAAILARGEMVPPRWIHRAIGADGRELRLPVRQPPRQVIDPELAAELRSMLVDTTTSGTARRAFRRKNGRPLLGPVRVAGKTGSLSGRDPTGRYEWFAGVAPADRPRVAVAVLLVQGDLWWRNASQIAAETLQHVFCEGRACSADLSDRWLRPRRSRYARRTEREGTS